MGLDCRASGRTGEIQSRGTEPKGRRAGEADTDTTVLRGEKGWESSWPCGFVTCCCSGRNGLKETDIYYLMASEGPKSGHG